ncbi:MAG TPA: hypothetical protein VGD40_01105 [Chryseosolibacter sp.]
MVRVMSIVLMILFAQLGFAQSFNGDTRELLDVIKQWTFAINAKDKPSLRQLYDNSVSIYGEQLSNREAVDLKNTFFQLNPSFRQKVISDPSFKQLANGAIRAEFIREVFEDGKWQKNPSYLLIIKHNGSYKISGESALSAQRRVNDRLAALSKPISPKSPSVQAEPPKESKTDIAVVEETAPPVDALDQEAVEEDSSASPDTLSDSTGITGIGSQEDTTLTAITEEVMSDETVAVPKKYVYILIGSLAFAAFIVLVARRPKRSGKKRMKTEVRETQLVRNDSGFEGFVLSLFDPHYFTQKRFSRKHVYAGNVTGQEFIPSLQLEFRNKESHVRIAIDVIFIPQLASREILSYSANQINRYVEFEEENGIEVYLVIGLEGSPHDPKETFLIPATDLREGVMGYKDLQPFRKYGMFFYNSTRRRLL